MSSHFRKLKLGLLSATMFLFVGTMLRAEPAESERLNALEKRVWSDEELDQVELDLVREIQYDPYQVHAFYLLSHLYLRKFAAAPDQMLNIKLANDLAQHTLDLDPKRDFGFVAVAEALDMMGQAERAIQLLGSLRESDIDPSWRYYFTMARLKAQTHPTEEVIGLLEQAISFRGAQLEILIPYVIAIVQTSTEPDGMVEALEVWDKKFPHDLFKQSVARYLSERGDHRKAHQVYRAIYNKNPYALEAKLNDAILLYQKLNRPKEAITALDALLKSPQLLHQLSSEQIEMIEAHLGASYLYSGDSAKAEKHLKKVVTKIKDQAFLFDFVIKNYRQAKQSKHLVRVLDELRFEIQPTGLLYALIGETQSEDLNDHRAAVQSFADAMLLEPGRSEFYNGKGLAHFRLKEFNEALMNFQDAVRVNPSDASAIYNVGCAFALLGKAGESLGALEEAFNLDPQLITHAKSDPDLRSLRDHPDFLRLLDTEEEKLGH